MSADRREIASDEPLDLVVRLRAAADKSANGGGECPAPSGGDVVTGTVVHLLVKTSHRTLTMVVSVPVGERLSILAVADGYPSASASPLADVVIGPDAIDVEVHE